MVISTKGRYALRLAVDIARSAAGSGGPVSLRQVSERQDISLKYLEQVAASLSQAGILRSTRGASGGYLIAHAADSITAGDILRASEGNMAPVACLAASQNECPRSDGCLTLPFWQGLDEAIASYIDSVSLQDLVEQGF